MDLSKLPKLSSSPEPPKTDPPPGESLPMPSSMQSASRQQPQFAPAPPLAAEAWISFGVGAILLFMVPTTLQYLSHQLFGTTFEPFADPTRPFPAKCDFILYMDGTKIFYRNMTQFWSDAAITAFALVLILDGVILMFVRRAPVVLIAFWFTLLAALGNLLYLIKTMNQGFPMLSALAVVIGGYIAMSQWATYKVLSGSKPSA